MMQKTIIIIIIIRVSTSQSLVLYNGFCEAADGASFSGRRRSGGGFEGCWLLSPDSWYCLRWGMWVGAFMEVEGAEARGDDLWGYNPPVGLSLGIDPIGSFLFTSFTFSSSIVKLLFVVSPPLLV